MSRPTDDLIKALRKDPVLYFDLIQRVMTKYQEARVAGPWKGPERRHVGTYRAGDQDLRFTWWRENPYGHMIALINQIRKDKEHGSFEYYAVPLNLTSRGVDADTRTGKVFEVSGTVPVEQSLIRAQEECDNALRRHEWDVLADTPMLAGPWHQGANYMKRDIMRGSKRPQGEDCILCVVRRLSDEIDFTWAVLARDMKRVIYTGKETNQEAAVGRADKKLRDLGWELA